MIVWIASYPRSGNTLLRALLHNCLGLETWGDNAKQPPPRFAELIGHRARPEPWERIYLDMRRSDRIFPVKTHDPPKDDSKAIYVVRDGRAAIVSYQHFLRDRGKHRSLSDLILGYAPYGSWGQHLDRWNPLERPDTLLVRYEDLVTKQDEAVNELSAFLRLEIKRRWKKPFEYFHDIDPRFFRKGELGPPCELRGEELELFWLFHGDWMDRLGYAERSREHTRNARLLRRCVCAREERHLRTEQARRLLERQLNAVLDSTSWRATAPLRAFKDWIGKAAG